MTTNKLLTSRLAAHIGTAHIEVLDYLDHQAEKAARVVDEFVDELLTLLPRERNIVLVSPYMMENEVRKLCDKLPNAIGKSIYDSLIEAGDKSANAVVSALVKSIPLEYMPVGILTQEAIGGAIIKAVIKRFKRKEPAVKLTKDEVKRRLKNLLIEPIERSVLEKIVLGGAAAIAKLMTWVKTTLNPRKLADLLIKGISGGKDRREIARDLVQELGATKAQAKRTARTEGARVATESNMAAYEELGSMVLGYMVHATPNPDSRWWHRQRSGTIYYKDPLPGQKGMDQLPHPPMEAKDPKERPEDAPETAYNCLCYLSPVFRPLDDPDGKFAHISQTADHKLIPDIIVYADWYAQATERLKRRSVGSRRYDAVTKKHGENASYFHFINPLTGELLPIEDIAKETGDDTIKRVVQARLTSDEARKRRRDVLLFGGVQ